MKFEDGVIEEWSASLWADKHVIFGQIYHDSKGRFEDGEFMKTSRLCNDFKGLKQGSKVKTLNSTYILGVSWEEANVVD